MSMSQVVRNMPPGSQCRVPSLLSNTRIRSKSGSRSSTLEPQEEVKVGREQKQRTEDRRTHLSQKATGCLPEFTESKSAVIFSSDDLLLMQVTCWYCDQVNQLKAEVCTQVYALLPRSSSGLRRNQDLN